MSFIRHSIMKQLASLLLSLLSIDYVYTETLQSCDSKIYCQGELLDTIQYKVKVFNLSKDFVDLIQINSPNVTLANFNNIMSKTNNNPTKQQLAQYIKENFQEEGELEVWTPPDYKNNPAFLEKISDSETKDFAKDLVEIWPKLARKVKNKVKVFPDKHSLISVPNGFIVPGGRFKEMYYWDSFWIIKGLLVSEMTETVRGMLENFISLVRRYGFIPNANRVYYLNRSQPPLLSMMVGLFIDATNDLTWLKNNIEILEEEVNWWYRNRTVEVKVDGITHTFFQYACTSGTPRPESYSEDIETCKRFESNVKETCYKNLKSGAESGWDFSTRWIFDPNSDVGTNITYINTLRVIPVDLNSYLCRASKEISKFHELLGNGTQSLLWWDKAVTLENSITTVMYDREDGIWYDYDITLSKTRKRFYPSNFAPLWTNSYNTFFKNQIGARAAQYLKKHVNINEFLGGIPTSLINSGEQWDLPNAWPPLQEIVILGLYNTENNDAKEIALNFAKKWIDSNKLGYKLRKDMYEKYDAFVPGQYGGGGEYTVQSGFGWTNGVVLVLLDKFPSISKGPENSAPPRMNSNYLLGLNIGVVFLFIYIK